MSKQFTKVLALGLAAMMVLSGCGGTSTETKTPENLRRKKQNSSRNRRKSSRRERKQSMNSKRLLFL